MEYFDIKANSYLRLKRYIAPSIQFPEKRKWKPIGKGAFGDVFLTEWQGSQVAIKMTKNNDKYIEHIKNQITEAEMLDKCVNSPHVCRFLAVVFEKLNKSMWLITQYYEHGSLKQYLQNQSKLKHNIPLTRKYDFIRQASIGLSFFTRKEYCA
eukprot:UN33419